jgi:anti-sigma factor RsiW
MTPRKEPDAEPLIARDATYYRAPDALRTRIRATVRAQARERARPMMWRWGGLAAAFATVALVSWNVAVLQGGGSEEERIVSEVATAHVRSLMAENHLNDVISTDQHTVKPWFNGKLDVAPPVIDLTAQGFTLIGGRLDYIDARPVGAVIYRRRQHIINLFVAQTADAQRHTAKMETMQGFNIWHWSDRGLNYWAVSDLGADELAEFGDKFEAASRSSSEG